MRACCVMKSSAVKDSLFGEISSPFGEVCWCSFFVWLWVCHFTTLDTIFWTPCVLWCFSLNSMSLSPTHCSLFDMFPIPDFTVNEEIVREQMWSLCLSVCVWVASYFQMAEIRLQPPTFSFHISYRRLRSQCIASGIALSWQGNFQRFLFTIVSNSILQG